MFSQLVFSERCYVLVFVPAVVNRRRQEKVGPKKHSNFIFREQTQTGAFKRMHPLPPAPPAAVYARPNRIDTVSSVSFRLMTEQLARRSIVVWGTSGSARAPLPRGVCDGLRLQCGAALAHWPPLDSKRMGAHTAMCAG